MERPHAPQAVSPHAVRPSGCLNAMETTPFQIVGCVFSSQPASERIDDFAHQARRERAVITAKNARQATFVKFGATDARLVALACRLAGGAPALRVGFACSASDRATSGKDGARISSRALAQASELAASARDGEVLMSSQLAALVLDLTLEFRARDIHLPGGRTAVACVLEVDAVERRDTSSGNGVPAERSLVEATPDGIGQALHALAAQADAMQRQQADLVARQDTLLEEMARATTRLQQLATQMGSFAQTMAQLESRRAIIDEVQARADGVTHLLGDLQVNLEMLGEQRAVIDDVGEKLARLDFTVQEAHSTLRALQRERELAERIERGIKALRARSAAGKASAGS
ncbi:MAG TPA: hypothetical protein VFZ28_11075 [Burkholderiaceae bacterium]|nr:hypothetical protein [Burkholderiaceae bacterium]